MDILRKARQEVILEQTKKCTSDQRTQDESGNQEEVEEVKEMAFGEIVEVLDDDDEATSISEEWPLECALRLEDHLSLNFKHGKPYNDKSRSLIFNLTDQKNPNARLALLYKRVTPEDFL